MVEKRNKAEKRISDKFAKAEFVNLLRKMKCFSQSYIHTETSVDIVVENGKNKDDWYYFELKTTTTQHLRDKKKYFSAISLNQWIEADRHCGHFFFVLVQQDDVDNPKELHFILMRPQEIKQYITGCYVHTDFTINQLEANDSRWKTSNEIRDEIANIIPLCANEQLFTEEDNLPLQKLKEYIMKE